MLSKLFTLILTFSLFQNSTSLISKTTPNVIEIEKSDYGLIFTNITVNGQKIKAMIDFGDPNVIQLSSTLVKDQNISVIKTKAIAKDIYGNSFEINRGTAKEIIIGQWKENNIEFSSSPGEMEGVAKQINSDFKAVIGWGYFSKYYTVINYGTNKFELFEQKSSIQNEFLKTPYKKNSNYLSVPVTIQNQNVNLIIDTGSPVSVIDSTFYKDLDTDNFNMKIGTKNVTLKMVSQDLSVLKQLNAVGIIGGDFIGKYKIHIDPFEHELTFENISVVKKEK
ncbi:hypothetical protein GTQ40_11290 [Flavobacteriaceae bacterium R38]|nr:hypothetical protein [Flavobacteriaceae bacterium R38]